MVVSITGADSQVDAAERKVIRNELAWSAIIEKVVDDGTLVEEGDVIIKFECKKLEDGLEDAEMAVENAKLTHQQASENLKLKRKEMDNTIRKAEQTVEDAKDDLAKYLDKGGEWEVNKDKAESNIDLAKRDLTLAQDKLNSKLKANADPELATPYSKSVIEAEKLGVDRYKKSLKEAISTRDMLHKYDHPREVRTRKDAVTDAGLEFERAKLIAATEIGLAQASLETKKTLLDNITDKFDELKEDKEKRLTVRATEKGLVIYYTGSYWERRGGQDVSVRVGEEIPPRQQLMIIPDMSTLEIHTKVLETLVNDLKPGETKALVGIRALSNLGKLPATLKWRAPQADQQHRWHSSGAKVYSAIIDIDDKSVKGLRPGMGAEVEMILDELSDVLSVPIASVFSEQEKSYCWRVTGGEPKRVEVVIGATNDQYAEIKSGLKENDRVMLVAPRGAADNAKGITKGAKSSNGKDKASGKSDKRQKASGKPSGRLSGKPSGKPAGKGEGRPKSSRTRPRPRGRGKPPAKRNTGS